MNVFSDLTIPPHSDSEQGSTDSPNPSDVDDDWFGLINATATWEDVPPYIHQLDTGSESTPDSDVNSDIWDSSSNESHKSNSDTEVSDLDFELTVPEFSFEGGFDFYDDLAFARPFEPMTPQSRAFGESPLRNITVRHLTDLSPVVI